MGKLFQELKRRNIFRVGVAYLVLSWLILQVGSVLAPILAVPPSALSIVVFLLVLGFPVALLLAWAFELTPEGLKRSADVEVDASVTSETAGRLNRFIIGMMAVIIAILLVDKFVITERVDEPIVADAAGASDLGEKSYDSIAVLPFVNMSEDKAQEFFSDGISEELLNLLAKTQGLRVAARTSSFAFKGQNQDIKGIGDQLDVATVLEGSVRKADTRLRITAQLIDVESGFHLWSETYDRELDDVFAIQDEISAAIVEALAVHLDGVATPSSASARTNVEAYEHYLKGREFIGLRTEDDINEALEHFSRAIEIDANYAPAYTGKADAYMLLSDESYGDIPVRVIKDLAAPLVARALQLDPSLADAHNSKGFLLSRQNRHAEALVSYDRALELRPSFAMAHMWRGLSLAPLQRIREALEAEEMAHRIDPLSLVISTNVIGWRIAFGDYDSALALARLMEKQAPDRRDRYGSAFYGIYTDQRDFSSAHETLLRVGAIGDEDESFQYALNQSYENLGSVSQAIEAGDNFLALRAMLHLQMCEEADERYNALSRDELRNAIVPSIKIGIAICRGDLSTADRIMSEAKGIDTSNTGPLYNDEPDRIVAPRLLLLALNSGDQTRIATVRSQIEDYLQRLETSGPPDRSWLLLSRLKVVDGDFDGAMEDLERALDTNRLLWFDRYDDVLRPIADRPDFQALFDKVDAHVNKERAELGWEPMETGR